MPSLPLGPLHPTAAQLIEDGAIWPIIALAGRNQAGRRTPLHLPCLAPRVQDNMVSGIYGHANPRHFHHPHQRAAGEGPSITGTGRVIPRRAGGRHGAAVHAGRPLVWI
jgi:hypothetical protein